MIESKQVIEWQDQAREEGFIEGVAAAAAEGSANIVLHFLSTKFGQLPEPVVHSVRSVRDVDHLCALVVRATQSASIDEWRHASPELTNGAQH